MAVRPRTPLPLGRQALLWQGGIAGHRGTIIIMGKSLHDMSLHELYSRVADLETLLSRTRHDVRSALAPAMLAADLMRDSTDPRMQRSGATVVRAIERVLGMLDSTREGLAVRPDQPPAPP